jgi:hypothetical protein
MAFDGLLPGCRFSEVEDFCLGRSSIGLHGVGPRPGQAAAIGSSDG